MIENQRMSGPEQPAPSAPVVSYPIYDGHGNMVATLAKSGSSFSVGNERRFDAWGQVRTGSGGPVQKYCANLGHLEDGESGLTYMRARYYEPWTGRFISEDPARDGRNWFVYCANDPISRADLTGEADGPLTYFFRIMSIFFGGVLKNGKPLSSLDGSVVRTMLLRAIENMETHFQQQVDNWLYGMEEAQMAYAAGNKDMGDALQYKAQRHGAYATYYQIGIMMLKCLLVIHDMNTF